MSNDTKRTGMSKEQFAAAAKMLGLTGPKTKAKTDFLIGSCIMALRDGGIPIDEALDLVLGEGTYTSIVDNCYEKANAK